MRLRWTNLTFKAASWPDKTYTARKGSQAFTVDHNGREWQLRGWTDGRFDTFKTGRTASELMAKADELAGGGAR